MKMIRPPEDGRLSFGSGKNRELKLSKDDMELKLLTVQPVVATSQEKDVDVASN
eukprot:CAMPEP_0202980728 /NCGR_PEP_ID=MMETSP1396-20130829/86598_1 /ASSEMBLY_ACC=CAM_ASM_000872 /TAXON_ID= /ORGANISM="Pseudokeronopsis sp., Strain Brazil" /LENGTH=53 /DNA_ID=CAMNT_0049720883 /DNA_START=28 /DNA_END=189 /DNA_ORIENTATION=-